MMKQRVTFIVDAEVVSKAKRYARARGVSLSSLVERYLRGVAGQHPTTFSSRWRGRFQPANRQGDPRYDRLAGKYLS